MSWHPTKLQVDTLWWTIEALWIIRSHSQPLSLHISDHTEKLLVKILQTDIGKIWMGNYDNPLELYIKMYCTCHLKECVKCKYHTEKLLVKILQTDIGKIWMGNYDNPLELYIKMYCTCHLKECVKCKYNTGKFSINCVHMLQKIDKVNQFNSFITTYRWYGDHIYKWINTVL